MRVAAIGRAMTDDELAQRARAAGSPTLARVLSGETCAGCGLCAGVSGGGLAMTIDAKGFARPLATKVSADAEAAIAAACPGAVIEPWPEHGVVHPFWGPVGEVATANATDPATRFAGSSGGVLSALAAHALETGLVDGVVHIGSAANDPIRSEARVSREPASVAASAGSRYAPSPVLASIGDLIDGDERFLLIGKPCDIGALRRLARNDARVDRAFPLMLSFFCGGVPSEHGTKAVLQALDLDGAPLERLRYRGNGWPGQFAATTHDGRSAEMSYAESWGSHLSSRIQYRCKICPDSVGGVADLAAADAWYGGDAGFPLFDEADGRSLVIVRTEAGDALWKAAVAHGAIEEAPLAIEEIDKMQPGQTRRKRLVGARTLAAQLLMRPLPQMHGLWIAEAGQKARWGEWLRNLVGSAKRIIERRR